MNDLREYRLLIAVSIMIDRRRRRWSMLADDPLQCRLTTCG
jgi:hypothetical protein